MHAFSDVLRRKKYFFIKNPDNKKQNRKTSNHELKIFFIAKETGFPYSTRKYRFIFLLYSLFFSCS